MAIRRKKNESPTTLGTLVARTAVGRAAAAVVVTRALWEEVAGVAFGRRTLPDRIDGPAGRRTLWIIVGSAGWAQELALHTPVILERLRARDVVVDQLRCRVRDVVAPDHPGVRAPSEQELASARRAAADEAAKKLGPTLARVSDPGLRGAIEDAARAVAKRDAEVALKEEKAKDRKPRIPGKKK